MPTTVQARRSDTPKCDVVAAGRGQYPDRRRPRRFQAGPHRRWHRRTAGWAKGANVSVILLAWVMAVLIRLATVAVITASSLMLGLVEGMSSGEVSLVVLAIGAGS